MFSVFGNAAQFVVLLLITRLATSYLSPEEMGRLSLVTAATKGEVVLAVVSAAPSNWVSRPVLI